MADASSPVANQSGTLTSNDTRVVATWNVTTVPGIATDCTERTRSPTRYSPRASPDRRILIASRSTNSPTVVSTTTKVGRAGRGAL